MKFPWMKSEEDFAVEEIIDKKFLRRFSHSGKVGHASGRYVLCTMTKKGITTHEAVQKVAKILGVGEGNIGYAGLKDKFAVAKQYITVKCNVEDMKNYESKNLIIRKIGCTGRPISVGDLVANRFSIKLPPSAGVKKIVVPNIFGPQRFGSHGDNHLIGLHLLQRRFDDALNMINVQSQKNFKSLHQVGKKRLKFYINAYQSYIFNECVAALKKPYLGYLRMPGYDSKLSGRHGAIVKNSLEKDGITTGNFRIDELRLGVAGAKRRAFIAVSLQYADDRVIFTLPKGSYASVVVEALISKRKLGI